jgi:hypothetical protein
MTGHEVGRRTRKKLQSFKPAVSVKFRFAADNAFNTVEKIQSDPRFQKFLRWLYKQQEGTFFRTRRNRKRTSQPYR